MTLVLCKLKGAGVAGDPYRCDLPSYQLVAHSVALGLAIADVRDDDVPADAPRREVTQAWAGGRTFTVAVVDAGTRTKWNEAIRKRYREGFKAWDADAAVET